MAVEFAAAEKQPRPQPSDQRTQGGKLEELRRLVEGRLADQRLVAVIEPVELGPEEQRGQARHADPGQLQGTRGETDRQDECDDDREDVSRKKRAAKDRIAAKARRWTSSLGDAKRRWPAPPRVQPEAPRPGQRGVPRNIRLGSPPCLHTHRASASLLPYTVFPMYPHRRRPSRRRARPEQSAGRRLDSRIPSCTLVCSKSRLAT